MERTQAIGVSDPDAETSAVLSAPTLDASDTFIFHHAEIIPLHSARAENSARTPIALVATAPDAPVRQPADSQRFPARAFDWTLALTLLIFVLPLMCLCALAVLLTSRGPLLYRQPRIGHNGKTFDCLKFRTMVVDADSVIEKILNGSPEAKSEWRAVQKLKCDPRVTPIGGFLRRYCLDELPQLFNVVAGDMSIVGPRPIVAAEIDRFGGDFAAYCSVKPGITGLWQVSGRHLLSYEQRVKLDAEYARSKCFSLDLHILWKTVPIILLGQNG